MFQSLSLCLTALVPVAAFAELSSAADPLQQELVLDIAPDTPLDEALLKWSALSHVEVMMSSESLAHKKTRGVHGSSRADGALATLLAGTGFGYRLDGRIVHVVPAPHAVATNMTEPQAPQGVATGRTPERTAGSVPADTIQEVVVTAQKREERVQNVPIAISVMGGKDLDKSHAQGVSEALNAVPGVTTTESYLGGGTNIAIRGVASSYPFFAGASAVGYYLDSVPFGLVKSAIGPDADAYDLERVEVLRGPQGTLYGASALNGVVRILTHDPELSEFDVKSRVSNSGTDHGGDNYRGDAMVNVPLIDDVLAARATVGYQHESGWIDQPNRKAANFTDVGTYRLKLAAKPIDPLTIGLSAWISRSNSGGPDLGYRWDKASSSLSQPTSTDYDAYDLKLGYQFSSFSVTSMTSDFWYRNSGILGLDIPGFGDVPGATFLNRVSSHVKSEEINAISTDDGDWRWSLGGMYRKATEDRYQFFTVFAVPTIYYYDTSKSYAAFGQLTRLFFDRQLEVTAGIRHFHDDISQSDQTAPGNPFVPAQSTAEANTPRASVTWHFDKNHIVYASYSQGFRSGFPQDQAVLQAQPNFPPVRPDRLTNYEIGTKDTFLDGRVSLDASAYRIDWEEIQLQLNVPYQGVPNIAVVNGAAAKGYGVDLDLSLLLAEGLSLSPYVSWNNLGLSRNVYSGGLTLFNRGDRPSGSPATTAGMALRYGFDLGSTGYRGTVTGSGNYTSKQAYHSISGTDVLIQDSDTIFISRASFSVESPSHWTFTLYGDNLNSEHGATARIFTSRIVDWDARVRPLTVGVQVDYRYR